MSDWSLSYPRLSGLKRMSNITNLVLIQYYFVSLAHAYMLVNFRIAMNIIVTMYFLE